MPSNNTVHDNDIGMARCEGAVVGWFAGHKPGKSASSNRFDSNHYHVYATDGAFWAPNEWTNFAAWRATGQDINSTLDSDLTGKRSDR